MTLPVQTSEGSFYNAEIIKEVCTIDTAALQVYNTYTLQCPVVTERSR